MCVLVARGGVQAGAETPDTGTAEVAGDEVAEEGADGLAAVDYSLMTAQPVRWEYRATDVIRRPWASGVSETLPPSK